MDTCLGEAAQGEGAARQLRLAQPRQEVGLVLDRVWGHAQLHWLLVPSTPVDQRVVPRGYAVKAGTLSPLDVLVKGAKLDPERACQSGVT